MTTWQSSTPSNQIVQTPHNHSLDEDSPSDLPELQEEETLESQEEYPQEVAEEAEEEEEEEASHLQYPHNKQPLIQETSSSAICHLLSQETKQSWKHS